MIALFIGGVGQLYQGDLDLGRRAVARLQKLDLGPDVLVEDLQYGAVAVSQRMEEVAPRRLLLIGAEQRGRPAGTVERRSLPEPGLEGAQRAVEQAVTGYVSIDITVTVLAALGVLPASTVTIEAEPETVEPSERLSVIAERALDEVVNLAEIEARRVPVLCLSDELSTMISSKGMDSSPALQALQELLDELRVLQEEARWGRAFLLRDRLRLAISRGATSERMDRLDWGLWWALIEELDRLEKAEAARSSAR